MSMSTDNENCYSGEPTRWTNVCYGITIHGTSIAGIRSSRSTGGVIHHSSIVTLDQESWNEWIIEAGKPGKTTVGCVSVQESLTLWLTAPFASITKAKKVLPSLLDIQIPFPLEDCLYQFLDIRRTPDNTTRALAVAARRKDIVTRLEKYQAQGLDPVLLDHEGVALWTQSIRELPLPDELIRIILYLEADHTTVVIGIGARFLNAHSIQHSFPSFSSHNVKHASSSDKLDNASVDLFVQAVQRFLHAEVETERPVQWIGCGPGALNHDFMDAVHRRLSEQWPGSMAKHQSPEFFLTRALTTRVLHREPLTCNLRRNDLTHPAILDRVRKQAVFSAMLFLIAGLLLCGINASWRFMNGHRLTRMKQAVSMLAERLAPGVRIPYGREVMETEQAVNKQSELTAPFLNTFTPLLSTRLKDVINAGKKHNLTFETLSLRKTNITITGTAEDWDQCDQFKQCLEAMGYSVALDREEAMVDTLVRFSMKGEVFSR